MRSKTEDKVRIKYEWLQGVKWTKHTLSVNERHAGTVLKEMRAQDVLRNITLVKD